MLYKICNRMMEKYQHLLVMKTTFWIYGNLCILFSCQKIWFHISYLPFFRKNFTYSISHWLSRLWFTVDYLRVRTQLRSYSLANVQQWSNKTEPTTRTGTGLLPPGCWMNGPSGGEQKSSHPRYLKGFKEQKL